MNYEQRIINKIPVHFMHIEHNFGYIFWLDDKRFGNWIKDERDEFPYEAIKEIFDVLANNAKESIEKYDKS